MPMEEWEEIPELDGFEASTLGRIRRHGQVLRLDSSGWSPKFRLPAGLRPPPLFLVPGYRVGTRRPAAAVARAVALAWLGYPPQETWLVGHVDGDRQNLKFENLFWFYWRPGRNPRGQKYWERIRLDDTGD